MTTYEKGEEAVQRIKEGADIFDLTDRELAGLLEVVHTESARRGN